MHWFGQMCTFKKERPGEIGARGANLPEPLHLSCAPGASAAPVLHSAWQNPATASPPHRSPAADCRLCAPGLCRPGAASSYRLPTPPGTTRPLAPASHLQTAKRRAHRNGRRGVNTQRAVSARRLTRQLRKSPRPQRRHLRYRLLARPLRERQRPQEQQRG